MNSTPKPRKRVSTETTSADIIDPVFNAIWNAIKEWDLQREPHSGYAGATGTDVMTILNAVRPFLSTKSKEV